MNSFERLIDGLRARGDVPDSLIDALVAERIALLQATIGVHEAELRQLEADRRLRNVGTLVERQIVTADLASFEKEVEHDLDHLEEFFDHN